MALRDLLNSVFYHWRPAAMIAGAIVALGVLAAVLLPPTYRAEARLLPLSASIYDTQSANGGPSPTQALDPAEVANVEMQLLGSLEIHRAVVRRQLPLGATTADINEQLNRFETKLHVTKATDANVIELSYTASDPEQAANALRMLLSEYFENRANVLTSGRVTFLVGQRDRIKAQLDTANAQIAAYQERNDIVDVAAQIAGAVRQDDLLRQNRLDAESALADGRRSIAALQTGARAVPAQVEIYSDNTEAARAIGEMQASVLELQSKRADLASRYMAGAPIVVQVDKQIAGLQTAIAQQKDDLTTTRRTGRNQYFDSSRDRLVQAQAALAGASARRDALAGQMADSRQRLQTLIAVADTVARLKLDRDVLADSFKALSGQVQQARVQLNQTSSAGSPNVRIIEAPTAPTRRSNPPALLIAGSLFAALLVSGAALLLLSSMRETFLTAQDVERGLGLPVLCAPLARGNGDATSERREYGRLIAAIDGLGGAAGKIVLLLAPSSRRSLQQAALGLGGALHRRSPGRTILIRFTEGAPVPADAAGLQIGRVDDIAVAVIGTDACSSRRLDSKLLSELAGRYDYVVVTAPTAATSFEGIELAQTADVALLVLEAETTRRPVARDLIAQVDNAGGRILGAMLLGRRQHIPAALYRVLIEGKGWRSDRVRAPAALPAPLRKAAAAAPPPPPAAPVDPMPDVAMADATVTDATDTIPPAPSDSVPSDPVASAPVTPAPWALTANGVPAMLSPEEDEDPVAAIRRKIRGLRGTAD